MADKGTTGKGGVDKETVNDFFKPYRMEVYVEPGPGGCTREKTN